MKKAIFYEGDYDLMVLNTVIEGLSSRPTLIRAGSKYGMKSFIQGRISVNAGTLQLTNENVLAFRDRDFDFPVSENPQLIVPDDNGKPDRKIRVSYRTTIENYLLTPANLFSFCENNRNYQGRFTERQLEEMLKQAANNILHYQAARHALGAIRTVAKQETKWVEDSGILPSDISIDACINAANNLIAGYNESLSTYTQAHFQEEFERFCAMFETPSFLESHLYLIYFHGKDLQTALSQYSLADFPFKDFYKKILETFDYTHFPDLIELRTHITSQP